MSQYQSVPLPQIIQKKVKAQPSAPTNGQIPVYNSSTDEVDWGSKASSPITISDVPNGNALEVLRRNAGNNALEFAASSGGATATIQEVFLTSAFTTSSTTYTDITGLNLTLPTRTNGKAMISMVIDMSHGSAGSGSYFTVKDNATDQKANGMNEVSATYEVSIPYSHVTTLAGQVIQARCKTTTGTLTVYGSGSDSVSKLCSLEVS